MLTGEMPSRHGIVGNGWYFRETGEVRFWLQSNRLIETEPIYVTARRLALQRHQPFTCAKLFWWYNQGASVDYSLTPKPHYGADGSKVFGIHGSPDGLPQQLEQTLGPFPFHSFWGPLAGLPCSQWIAQASAAVLREHCPSLTLVYLPHLDYDLQRFGPDWSGVSERLGEVDACAGIVIKAAREVGARIVVVSEYGLVPVRRAILINRLLREAGWLNVRAGPFGEMLDTFLSQAFAVVDHQIAHIYVHQPDLVQPVADRLREVPGIDRVLDREGQREIGLDHSRSGELVAIAEQDAWFAYPYWMEDRCAPDFARTVDIHRKPGYDPCELLLDPALRLPKLRVARRLLQKKLGMRYLMDVVPLDPMLIRGSHGLNPIDPLDGPIFLTDSSVASPTSMCEFKHWLLRILDLD